MGWYTGDDDLSASRGRNGFRYLVGLHGIKQKHDSELCLFPTLLKSDFHGVRSTIERYSKMGRIEMPSNGPVVGGIEINKSKDKTGQRGRLRNCVFRVMASVERQ